MELLFRQCSNCLYIEDCPEPVVLDDGSNDTPNYCPKKGHIKFTSRVSELIPKDPDQN
jgi:hypothetical protein